MRLLVIGGTRFLGRHLMQAALARGDQLTLFNRGQSWSGPLPAGVTWRQGDRQVSLAALAEGRWDAVIDCCAYRPGEVQALAQALQGRAGRYALVSSISAYADASVPTTEDAPLAVMPPGADASVVNGDTYGPLKAACERELLAAWGAAQSLILRPGLIVGPHDPTGRFSWWPARLARAAAQGPGSPVLAPGPAEAPVQCIDVRDLASFILGALDDGRAGAYNLTSAPGGATMATLLQACAQAAGAQPEWHWVPGDWLQAQGVQPWMDLPLWLPQVGEHAAFMQVPVARALAAGLSLRPLAETAADTLVWWQGLPAEQQAFPQTGLAPEREAALRLAWARR
jgi:2'-hydroxyisoflavone reductase